MSRRTYTVVAERADGWWAIRVPDVRGAHSQARRLEQVPEIARDAIAAVLDVDAGSFELRLEPQLGLAAATSLASLADARRAAEEAQTRLRQVAADAAAELLASGLSMRDAGELLGISHQRVAQIAHGGALARSTPRPVDHG